MHCQEDGVGSLNVLMEYFGWVGFFTKRGIDILAH